MYKDKDLQREANRQASQKYRDSMTGKGMTVLPEIIPSSDIRVIPCDTPDIIPKGATLTKEEKAARFNALIADKPKRGKDIKCFADLPPDIQQTINTLSDDKTEHKRRTAIAINYQHLFPDRYHSTGVRPPPAKRVDDVIRKALAEKCTWLEEAEQR